jgi:hypothetical protein
MSSQSQNPFKWRHFQADIILLCLTLPMPKARGFLVQQRSLPYECCHP